MTPNRKPTLYKGKLNIIIEADFEFEKTIAQTNKKLADIETVFFLTSPETAYISSSIVREIIANNGEYTKLVPKSVRWC